MTFSASYAIVHDEKNNVSWVNTSVTWQKKNWSSSKSNCFHEGQRSGTIYTQARFKSWLKKYGLPLKEEEISSLPKKTVWS
jgi:hypothetical protein